jgi:hypothetical protein
MSKRKEKRKRRRQTLELFDGLTQGLFNGNPEFVRKQLTVIDIRGTTEELVVVDVHDQHLLHWERHDLWEMVSHDSHDKWHRSTAEGKQCLGQHRNTDVLYVQQQR